MFNAIFGNFLFSRPTPTAAAVGTGTGTAASSVQSSEASTQTSNKTTISTQTYLDDLNDNQKVTQCNQTTTILPLPSSNSLSLDEKSNEQIDNVNNNINNYAAAADADGENCERQIDPSLDWVIVDRSEEADKCNLYEKGCGNVAVFGGGVDVGIEENNLGLSSTNDESIREKENLIDMDDRNGQDEPNEINNLIHENSEQVEDEDGGDVLLGSFFDKNEKDSYVESNNNNNNEMLDSQMQDNIDVDYNQLEETEHDENTQIIAKRDETWLLTPLPCLTSITTSQRSIVENDPLENLLIEHPSMSVFMTATSTSAPSSASSTQRIENNKLEEKDEEKCDMDLSLLPLFYPNNQFTQQNELCDNNKFDAKKDVKQQQQQTVRKIEKKRQPFKPQQQQQQQQENTSLKRSVEKRKESERSSGVLSEKNGCAVELVVSTVNTTTTSTSSTSVVASGSERTAQVSPASSIDSTISNLRKREKKNKKSNGANGGAGGSGSQSTSNGSKSSNKENQQIKTLLMNEFKKACINQQRNDSALYNKNQMKRNNKNATFSSNRNANVRQRKYHKLQQPLFITTNVQF